jgi:hypothetical protein
VRCVLWCGLASMPIVREIRTCGLRVRCSACPHVHRHTPPQVTRTAEPPWIPLEQGELQLKLQLTGRARPRSWRSSTGGVDWRQRCRIEPNLGQGGSATLRRGPAHAGRKCAAYPLGQALNSPAVQPFPLTDKASLYTSTCWVTRRSPTMLTSSCNDRPSRLYACTYAS